jgi:hypothetical protein
MNHFDLSIVISTFNRERNVIEIINLLNKQNNFLKKNIEIIICDSNSKKRFSIINYLKQFNNLKILYFNCKVNHQAFKRNFGLKKSSSNSVIFIDDDCFPDVNFLFNYYRYLKLNKSKIIYCGLVEYIKTSKVKNLIHYRQSRQISLVSKNKNQISAKNFVSMNMAIRKSFFLRKNFFNINFRLYGFEDFECAFSLIKNHFKIILIKPLIYHKDFRNFSKFLLKYTYLGEYGIVEIFNINSKAAEHTIFYKIENNSLIKIILKFPKLNIFLYNLEKFLIFIESRNKIYLNFIYRLGILIAFLRGVYIRKQKTEKKYQKVQNTWYK